MKKNKTKDFMSLDRYEMRDRIKKQALKVARTEGLSSFTHSLAIAFIALSVLSVAVGLFMSPILTIIGGGLFASSLLIVMPIHCLLKKLTANAYDDFVLQNMDYVRIYGDVELQELNEQISGPFEDYPDNLSNITEDNRIIADMVHSINFFKDLNKKEDELNLMEQSSCDYTKPYKFIVERFDGTVIVKSDKGKVMAELCGNRCAIYADFLSVVQLDGTTTLSHETLGTIVIDKYGHILNDNNNSSQNDLQL